MRTAAQYVGTQLFSSYDKKTYTHMTLQPFGAKLLYTLNNARSSYLAANRNAHQ